MTKKGTNKKDSHEKGSLEQNYRISTVILKRNFSVRKGWGILGLKINTTFRNKVFKCIAI